MSYCIKRKRQSKVHTVAVKTVSVTNSFFLAQILGKTDITSCKEYMYIIHKYACS